MTVLLVDDHKGIRELEKSMFASLFDTFYESASGEEAVSIFNKHKPDWVLMDYKMKGMTGLEACKKIKLDNMKAKVIMVTQFEDVHLKKKAFDAGIVAFVSKAKLATIKNIILTYKEN